MIKAILLVLGMCLSFAQTCLAVDAQDWDLQGRYFYKQGDMQRSIVAFNQAIDADDKFTDSYFNRALVYVQIKDLKAAESDFDRFLRQESEKKIFFTFDIADIFIKNSQPDVAKKYITKAIDAQPPPKAYVLRSKINAALGKPKDALEDASRALELDRSYNMAYYEAGNANMLLGNYDKALLDLNKFVDLNPDNADGLIARAYILYKQGDKKNSLSDYNKAVAINPKYKDLIPKDLR